VSKLLEHDEWKGTLIPAPDTYGYIVETFKNADGEPKVIPPGNLRQNLHQGDIVSSTLDFENHVFMCLDSFQCTTILISVQVFYCDLDRMQRRITQHNTYLWVNDADRLDPPLPDSEYQKCKAGVSSGEMLSITNGYTVVPSKNEFSVIQLCPGKRLFQICMFF
jgi:hypothetical protein